MEPAAVKRAFNRVSRAGLGKVDRTAARYVQGSNQYLIIAVSSALPFAFFFLFTNEGRLWPAALIEGALIVVWLGCFALNVAGWVRTSSVIQLIAPIVAFTALVWLLSYRSGFLLPMLMTAVVSFVTFSPRMLRWGISLTAASALTVVWSFLDARVAEPRLDVSPGLVDGLLIGNVVLVTVVMSTTSALNHYYLSRERGRAERELERAEAQARTDPLTKLMNRRGMTELLAALPLDKSYAMALVDLDRFKEVNDKLGHSHGDVVLEAVARVLEDSIGEVGIVSRWGGEEFLVLMTDIRLSAAVDSVERARKVLNPPIRPELRMITVTFSAGIAAASPGVSWEVTVREADALLYEAKKAGRNQVRSVHV
jgi:diguanylate cyclase (GGDEF)-like protein